MYICMTFFLVTLPVSQNVTQNSRTPVIPQKRNIVTCLPRKFSDCIRANSPDYVIFVRSAGCAMQFWRMLHFCVSDKEVTRPL